MFLITYMSPGCRITLATQTASTSLDAVCAFKRLRPAAYISDVRPIN